MLVGGTYVWFLKDYLALERILTPSSNAIAPGILKTARNARRNAIALLDYHNPRLKQSTAKFHNHSPLFFHSNSAYGSANAVQC